MANAPDMSIEALDRVIRQWEALDRELDQDELDAIEDQAMQYEEITK